MVSSCVRIGAERNWFGVPLFAARGFVLRLYVLLDCGSLLHHNSVKQYPDPDAATATGFGDPPPDLPSDVPAPSRMSTTSNVRARMQVRAFEHAVSTRQYAVGMSQHVLIYNAVVQCTHYALASIAVQCSGLGLVVLPKPFVRAAAADVRKYAEHLEDGQSKEGNPSYREATHQ